MSLTALQSAVIHNFALSNGRTWKGILRTLWSNGKDADQANGYVLRQIRNQFGPTWLVDFKLDLLSLNAQTLDEAKAHVQHVATKVGAKLTDWHQSNAKEWQYATLSCNDDSFSIGVSTGGVISTDGRPFTPDAKALVLNAHLFEAVMLMRMHVEEHSAA